jgi:hypothetical protein
MKAGQIVCCKKNKSLRLRQGLVVRFLFTQKNIGYAIRCRNCTAVIIIKFSAVDTVVDYLGPFWLPPAPGGV